ncbi:MAG: hypothetical protein QM723_21400 [Myxococcaceae bacterium]
MSDDQEYLNVDLEFRSRKSLKKLTAILSDKLEPLYTTARFATFEVGCTATVDAAFEGFERVFDGLTAAERKEWLRHDCVFAIGLEAAAGRKMTELRIANKTFECARRMGAEIAVTVYPRERRKRL